MRRSSDGNLDSKGSIWAVPYRWGSMVIAYNKKEFQKRKLAPLEVIVTSALNLSGIFGTLICAYAILSQMQFQKLSEKYTWNNVPFFEFWVRF